ncbi:MAG: carboxypeptidase-like regulatory domain-containing protein [Planctomycetaceae bacterium]|nr:carboxypeptidase-like regulatory domain-containing protein [Planctomycetaceae bacterium]
MPKHNTTTLILLTMIAIAALGCQRGPKLEGLVPGRGNVVFQDGPLADATVTFSPKENKPGVRVAVATTDDKGTFTLMTLGQKGIYPGDYRVSIVKNVAVETPTNRERVEQMQHGGRPVRPQKIESMIPVKFNDEKKSGLEFLIGEQGNKELRIEIM